MDSWQWIVGRIIATGILLFGLVLVFLFAFSHRPPDPPSKEDTGC